MSRLTAAKLSVLNAIAFVLHYDDYPEAFIPEMWANESIAILNIRGL